MRPLMRTASLFIACLLAILGGFVAGDRSQAQDKLFSTCVSQPCVVTGNGMAGDCTTPICDNCSANNRNQFYASCVSALNTCTQLAIWNGCVGLCPDGMRNCVICYKKCT